MNVDTQMNDVKHKIEVIKENRGNKYRYPRDILIVLSMREAELEDQLFFLKSANI
mgnify:CR=1 FL=1